MVQWNVQHPGIRIPDGAGISDRLRTFEFLSGKAVAKQLVKACCEMSRRDGAFEGRFPRHFVPGYDRCCPYGMRWQTFRNSL